MFNLCQTVRFQITVPSNNKEFFANDLRDNAGADVVEVSIWGLGDGRKAGAV